MDNQAAYYNAAAILTAIYARNRTGTGTDIDISAVEAGIELIGPLMLDVSVNGRSTRTPDFPLGNRLEHPNAAPHGVYPTIGDDRWIAIAVFDDAEWKALLGVMRDPAWADDARFRTQDGRHANQDALDALVAAWTAERDRHELMELLQAAGVRAGAVQDAQDCNERDPQFAARGTFFELDHPVIGPARFEGSPFQASQYGPDLWRSAPLLGEDTRYVLTTVLNLEHHEVDELEATGVI